MTPRPKRNLARVRKWKVEITQDLERRLNMQCARYGKTRQYILGRLIETWVTTQESQYW